MNNWLNEATQEFERRTNLTDVQYMARNKENWSRTLGDRNKVMERTNKSKSGCFGLFGLVWLFFFFDLIFFFATVN